jgi:hypothetical protein
MTYIQLGNKGEWVNPQYVTSVTPKTVHSYQTNAPDPKVKSEIWVVGNAGYVTYGIESSLTPTEVVAKLNATDCTESCSLNEGVCPKGMECAKEDNDYTFSTIEGKYITRVIQNPNHGVMTRKVWDAVTGAESGWTDGNKTFSTVDDLLQAISMADDSYEVIEEE